MKRMHKKGFWWGFIFSIFIFICFITVGVALSFKFNVFEKPLGTDQINIMKASSSALKIPLLAESAAKRSAEQAVYELGLNGGLFNLPSSQDGSASAIVLQPTSIDITPIDFSCGDYTGYALWQSESEFCEIDVKGNFEKYLQHYLDEYLKEYKEVEIPLGNYEFFIIDNNRLNIEGVAIKNAIYDDNIIKYSVKPSFEISVSYTLSYYDELMAELKEMIGNIISCEKREGLVVCFSKEKQKTNNELDKYGLSFVDIEKCGSEEGEESEETDLDVANRMGKFCVKSNEQFTVYDWTEEDTEERDIIIKFAAYIVDLPPEPLTGVKVYDNKKDNGSVIVTWNRDKASDAKTSSIYLSKTNFLRKKIQNRAIDGVNQVNILDIENAELIPYIDLTECASVIIEKGCFYAKYNKPLAKGRLYNVRNELEDYYIYIVDGLDDEITYNFAVTAIDANGNEIDNDKNKGNKWVFTQDMNYAQGKSSVG